MIKYGSLATLLLAGLFYLPIPSSDPCRAIARQENQYLYSIGALKGFEAISLSSRTEDIVETTNAKFSVVPTRWGCAIDYWRNEADDTRIDTAFRSEFKKLLLLKITLETGKKPEITDETLNELYLEFMKKIY